MLQVAFWISNKLWTVLRTSWGWLPLLLKDAETVGFQQGNIYRSICEVNIDYRVKVEKAALLIEMVSLKCSATRILSSTAQGRGHHSHSICFCCICPYEKHTHAFTSSKTEISASAATSWQLQVLSTYQDSVKHFSCDRVMSIQGMDLQYNIQIYQRCHPLPGLLKVLINCLFLQLETDKAAI